MWALFFLIQLAFWYRVFICNCHFLYLSDGHLKTKKSYNPIIFVNLIYGHFDILRSQYGQVKKSGAFQVCAKIVLRLHTTRAENPDTPQTHPCTSNFHEYHLDILWTPPRTTPRHLPDISGEQVMTTDDNRRQ